MIIWWIIFCFLIGALAVHLNRSIGFWGAFIISFILSPLIGLIWTLLDNKKKENMVIKKNELADNLLSSGRINADEYLKLKNQLH